LFFAVILVECGLVMFQIPGAAHLKSATNIGATSTAVTTGGTCSPALSFWDAGRMSIRTFLPVDLPLLINCDPSEKYVFLLRSSDWATIFKVAGWILVPLGVAGLTGILKRTE
jgi:hypothetical protein